MKFSLIVLGIILLISNISAQKIYFYFYYQTLCPSCYDYLTEAWKPALETPGLNELFDVLLFPYGTTQQEKVGDEWQFKCEHGENQCYGNMVEACTQNYLDDVEGNLAIICIEEQFQITHDFNSALQTCAVKFFNIDIDQVQQCVTSQSGNSLMHKLGKNTESLIPPLENVPWLTIDEIHDAKAQEEIRENSVKWICQHSLHASKVKACSQYLEKSNKFLEKIME